MSDATGHMDRPGAGPTSTSVFVGVIPANHYTHRNPETKKVEVVRANPPDTPDEVVKDFSDRTSAELWTIEEWIAGRLK